MKASSFLDRFSPKNNFDTKEDHSNGCTQPYPFKKFSITANRKFQYCLSKQVIKAVKTKNQVQHQK